VTKRSVKASAPPSDAEVLAALRALERVIFKYPIAIQAAFAALAREGRRYAATPEGARLLARLDSAHSMGRARVVWEVLSLSAFTEKPDSPLPTFFVDNLVRALRTRHLEPLLSRVFERGF
jgi:hypothetical protein